jgi:hypothetical protein
MVLVLCAEEFSVPEERVLVEGEVIQEIQEIRVSRETVTVTYFKLLQDLNAHNANHRIAYYQRIGLVSRFR